MTYFLVAVALFGHLALCIFVINRLHAVAFPYWFLKLIDSFWYGLLVGVPFATVAWIVLRPDIPVVTWATWGPVIGVYATACYALATIAVLTWLRHWFQWHLTPRLKSNHTVQIDVVRELGMRPIASLIASISSRLPANQVLQLAIHTKEVQLPSLPAVLDGLSIAHLSDLHFTGQLTRAFFEEIVRRTNDMDADLVAITGDIIDKPKCIPWLTDVLGKLRSREGVFFVLGNHDLRVRDEQLVRSSLGAVGHVDLGGRWVVRQIRGEPVLIAGNELPWFVPAANLSKLPGSVASAFRILLSHSPDQFEWARQHQIDLMLAGHTHGGQIRLPWIGPIFSPSRFGVKYASGTFFEPPTLMHVSRGISGTRHLRLNCPPELTKLVLRPEKEGSAV